MANLGEADIAGLLEDMDLSGGAVSVTFGTITVTGIFDRTAIQVFDGDMPTTIIDGLSVHVQLSALPGLDNGSELTVDGIEYKALRVLPYGDGAMARIALRLPEEE